MKQLKDTLNLPSTKFSMKANLAQKEPSMLDYWKNLNLYQLIQEKNKDKPPRVRCTAIKKSGGRCKNTTKNKNKRCYAHQ